MGTAGLNAVAPGMKLGTLWVGCLKTQRVTRLSKFAIGFSKFVFGTRFSAFVPDLASFALDLVNLSLDLLEFV